MSEETPIVPLGPNERRVLGVLVEKALTTPESYPLTLNALVNGCNQKSNRDPVTDLADDEIEDVIPNLQKARTVIKLTGGSSRVEKWRHDLYDAWRVTKGELAILAELLLRGSQTEGELRSRASRMSEIADVEQLRELLKPMVERKLVVYLTPEGRRGTILTHGLYPPDEMAALRNRFSGVSGDPASAPTRSAAPVYASAPAAPAGPSVAQQIATATAPLIARLDESQRHIQSLNAQIERLRRDLEMMAKGLGMDLDG